MENIKKYEMSADMIDVDLPTNTGMSVVDTAFKNKGKFVQIWLGNRHFTGLIISIDEYFNLVVKDGRMIRHIKATKITEIDELIDEGGKDD